MRIVIVTGRTGGHFFPAKTLAQALKKQSPEVDIHYILSQKSADELTDADTNDELSFYHYFPYFPWRGFFRIEIFHFIYSLIRSFFDLTWDNFKGKLTAIRLTNGNKKRFAFPQRRFCS